MQLLGPAPQAIEPDKLATLLKDPLKQLMDQTLDQVTTNERLSQIRKAHYNWRMVKGDQFLSPGFTSGPGGTEMIDYVSAVDGGPGADEGGAGVVFAYAINHLGGDCWKFVAVMGQSAPNVKGVADDIEEDASIQAAKDADACIRDLFWRWRADDLQRVLAFHQYTTGPIFGLVTYVADKGRYGSTVEPQIDVQEDPQTGLPVPVEGEPKTYENGDVELHLCTVLDVAIPFGAKRLEDCGWLEYEYMESKWKLLARYPEKLKPYRDAEPPDDDLKASSTYSAEANDSIQNPTGTGRAKKPAEWRYNQLWLRPYMYEGISGAIPQEDGSTTALRDILYEQFPDGARMVRVGSVVVDIIHESMDDAWAVCKTGRGEKILEDPVCHDSIPIQRATNDLIGLAIETVLRAVTKVIVDQTLLDRKALSENEAVPHEIILTSTPNGTDISKMIAEIPPARVSDQFKPLADMLRAYGQDISGIRPELSGGGVPTQTFREAKQRKDQALMQLSPQMKEQKAFWEHVALNGVKQRAKYGIGTIKTQKKTGYGIETDLVDMAQLQTEGWHAEADDGIPMSFTERHDALYSLLKEYPPEVQQALALLDPTNLEKTLELLQLPDFESPVEQQKKKTLADIQEWLKNEPVQDAGPDGQPGPPQPFPPIDDYDDHGFVSGFLNKWMVANPGRKAKLQSPKGFENIHAAMLAHQQAAQQQDKEPPMKGGLNISSKLLELSPEVQQAVLQAAGLPPVAAPPPPATQGPAPQPGPQHAPQDGEPAPPEQQEAPLPEPPPEGPGPAGQ